MWFTLFYKKNWEVCFANLSALSDSLFSFGSWWLSIVKPNLNSCPNLGGFESLECEQDVSRLISESGNVSSFGNINAIIDSSGLSSLHSVSCLGKPSFFEESCILDRIE